MDYYQGVVIEYLRSHRATFVNPECLIQLDDTKKEPAKGAHWYCDIVAVNFEKRTVFLCEVTYSKTLQALMDRLQAWSSYWPALCEALRRDCRVPKDWKIQPWVFFPEADRRPDAYEKKIALLTNIGAEGNMPTPKVTYLESVAPWKYPWDRKSSKSADDE